MCLSFIISATAADTLKRVPSTIPGTDKEYNYVENVTVKIPGTNVTYELNDVYEKVGVVYEDDIPVYRFSFLEKDSGSVILKQDGEYANWFFYYEGYTELDGRHSHNTSGDGYGLSLKINDTFNHESGHYRGMNEDDYAAHNFAYVKQLYTCIQNDGVLNPCKDYDNHTCIAIVEFYWGTGCKCDNGYEYPYDLISYDRNGSYYDILLEKEVSEWVAKDIEKIDISLLDVNYQPNEEYKIIEGANAVVDSDTKSLKIRVDAEFSKFTGVTVDGKTVDSSNYTASEGSTIIEFKGEYLSTLSVGGHTVAILFTDGEATTQFEIKRNTNNGDVGNTDTTDKTDNPVVDVEIPNTDGGAPVPSVFAVMALGGMALITFKKKTYKR